MVITPAPENDEKDQKWNKDIIFHTWFYILIFSPLLVLYFTSDTKDIPSLLGEWIGIIGIPIILSSIIELFINLLSKKRPLLRFNNRFIIITTAWAALFAAGFIYNQFDETKSSEIKDHTTIVNENDFENTLINESRSINSQCPIKINEVIRLDRTSVPSTNVFRFNYSFTFSKEEMTEYYESIGYDAEKEKETLRQQLIEMYKTQEYLQDFRVKKITIQAHYYDSKGKLLYELSATPSVDF